LNPLSSLIRSFLPTPTSGNGNGLVAFETIGNLQNSTFNTATIPASMLTTDAAVVVDMSTGVGSLTGPFSSLVQANANINTTTGTNSTTGTSTTSTSTTGNLGTAFAGAGTSTTPNLTNTGVVSSLTNQGSSPLPLFTNTGIALMNPNSTPATVTVTLDSPSGTPTTLSTITVPAMQQVSQFVNQMLGNTMTLTLPVLGVVNFHSDVPIAVTAFQFRGNSFANVPVVNTSGVSGTTVSGTASSNGSNGMQMNIALPDIATGVGGTGALLLPQFVMGGGLGE